VELNQRYGLAMFEMVVAGVGKNTLNSHRFNQLLKDQPIEFVRQADEGISLVAVLSVGPTEHLIRGMHHSLFRAENRIGLVLIGKG
ncbi:bifunctional aspartate kinase/homoserine dehydrogenase II, partial [Pectobacterium brasiliense]|nr:bifunctional aspartate kinase/homoserine dehydrogenase II [Pectobacterium brasiliense]